MARFNLAEALRTEIGKHRTRSVERATIREINLVASTVNVSLRGSPSHYRNVPVAQTVTLSSFALGDTVVVAWDNHKPLVIAGPIS